MTATYTLLKTDKHPKNGETQYYLTSGTGMVRFSADPKRAFNWHIATSGTATARHANKIIEQYVKRMVSGLGGDEREQIQADELHVFKQPFTV